MSSAIRNLSVNYQSDLTFDDIEDEITQIIRKNISCILNKDRGYINSLNWIFTNISKPGEFNYGDCCEIIGVHPDLLRIRLQYEFYCRQLNYENLFIGKVPNVIIDEVSMLFIPNSIAFLTSLWSNPGSLIDNINLDRIDMNVIIKSLLEREIIGIKDKRLYVVGRIPKHSKNSWSKYWNFYD